MPPARVALYLATVGAVILTLRSVLIGPPPLQWALLGWIAYLVLVVAGVMLLRLRMFVDAVVRGPPGSRGVALTFDDGPHPIWTLRVLDILEAHGARATFFLVGRKAEEHPDVVRAILARGHQVGLHSYAHDRLFSLRREGRVREDLERGLSVLERITGTRPVIFRPPIGHTNPAIARVVDALDLTVVGWTVSGHDGVGITRPAHVAARVRRELRDGIIVALHDAAEKGDREPAAVLALPAILDAIAAERLEVVPLEAWVTSEESPAPRSTPASQSVADGSTTVKRAPPPSLP